MRVQDPHRALNLPIRWRLFGVLGLVLCLVAIATAAIITRPAPTTTPTPGASPSQTSVRIPTPTATTLPTASPSPTPTACQLATAATNPIAAENSCPGTSSWRFDHPQGPDDAIEGFPLPASVNADEQLSLYVSTTASSYRFSIYRLGYYQGLGARLVFESRALAGIQQPSPTVDPSTRMVSCSNWRNPVQLRIPASWVAGVYIVKMLSSAGYMRYMLFIVRNDTSTAPILVQIPLLTYEAYNAWGGYSLYLGRNAQGVYTYATRAYVVSFDRPYFLHAGLMHLPLYDYDLIYWLERASYDVTYVADIDIDANSQLLSQRKLAIFSGHTEYWSTSMRANVTSARDSGVSLAFFGANDVYWHVRLQDSALGSARVEVCYKDATLDPLSQTDPTATTVRWREAPLSNPENSLLGQMYEDPVRTTAPLVLSEAAAPFMHGTSLHVGSSLPGLLGGEFDREFDNGHQPASVSTLAESPVQCQDAAICPPSGTDTATTTLYETASGARVFDAGTFQWSWGLCDAVIDPALPAHTYSSGDFQTFTANIVAYLLYQ